MGNPYRYLHSFVLHSFMRVCVCIWYAERYYQLVGEGRRNWLKAERYYRQALQLLPENGNPHNQLAIVATYNNNNLSAVHRYFRSLVMHYIHLPCSFAVAPCSCFSLSLSLSLSHLLCGVWRRRFGGSRSPLHCKT